MHFAHKGKVKSHVKSLNQHVHQVIARKKGKSNVTSSDFLAIKEKTQSDESL